MSVNENAHKRKPTTLELLYGLLCRRRDIRHRSVIGRIIMAADLTLCGKYDNKAGLCHRVSDFCVQVCARQGISGFLYSGPR